MGFDLHGLAPHNPNNHKKPTPLDWTRTDLSEDEKEKYFKASDDYQDKVRGEYFRANAWWWRPIWNFTCSVAGDILTLKDIERGHYNDFHKISKTKANRIAKRLRAEIKKGTAKKCEDDWKRRNDIAKIKNEKIEKEISALREKAILETGNSNIVPADYPKLLKKEWDELFRKKSWDSSYPFSVKVLEQFAEFCEQSGGFEIG